MSTFIRIFIYLFGAAQVIPGTDELLLASAFSGEVATATKGTFEQAIIEAQDHSKYYQRLFFDSGMSRSCVPPHMA